MDNIMDTYIELYSTDGTTLIYSNDDYEDLESRINWSCKTDGMYYVRIMHYTHSTDNIGYDDNGIGNYDISISEETLVDVTPPEFTTTYPKVTNVKANSFEVLVKSNEDAIYYYIGYAHDDLRLGPSVDQVIAGADGNDSHSNAISGDYGPVSEITEEALNFTNLNGETEYDVFIVAMDAWHNKSTVKKVSVTTTEPTVTLTVW